MYIVLVIITFITPTNYGYTQETFFKHFNIENGLTSSNIYDVLQDDKGYMWFASDYGVTKYDGTKFKYFYVENGLGDNHIFKIFQDKVDRIWFLPQNGKLSYFHNDSVFNAGNSSLLKGVSYKNQPYYSFYENDSGNIFLGQYRTRILNITTEGAINSYKADNNITSIWEDNNGIAAIRGYMISTLDDKQIDSLPRSIVENFTRVNVFHDTAIIANGKQIFFYYKKKILDIHAFIESEYQEVISISVINDEIWLGTRNGVLKAKSINALINGKYDVYLRGLSVSCSYRDSELNYWFSTLEDGVYVTPSFNIQKYDNDVFSNGIKRLGKDWNNRIWVGDSKGYYYILTDNTVFKSILIPNKFLEVTGIYHNAEIKTTWITSKSAVAKFSNNNKYFLPVWANSMLFSRSTYWLSTSMCYKITKGNFDKSLTTNPKVKRFPPDDIGELIIDETTYTIRSDNNNDIWLGTKSGLWVIDSGSTRKEKISKGKINTITNNKQYSIVGTEQAGVVIYENRRAIDTISEVDGLSSNCVNAIKVVNNDRIWVGTSEGLDLLEKSFKKWQVLNVSAILGIGKIKVNDLELHNEYVYIATEDGLVRFNMNSIPKRSHPPPIVIDKVSINNKIVNTHTNIKLSYTSNNLAIEFTGISYKSDAFIKYLYTLEGLDKEWYSTELGHINYASLPAGKYRFKVKAVNTLGIESADNAVLDFEVIAPVWKRSWFYSLLFLLLIVGSTFFWIFRLRYMRRRYQLKQYKDDAERMQLEYDRDMKSIEQKALRMQMNPHFIFNALNTIKGYYTEKNHIEGSEYISNFSKLLRLILESDDHVISLETEIEILKLYLEISTIRYANMFKYTLNVEDGIDISKVSIIPMLLQPFIENAIIHGIGPKDGKGKIIVSFTKLGNSLVCIVEDDGVGRHYIKSNISISYESKAIDITRKRLSILSKTSFDKYEMQIEDLSEGGIATGTKITITIPFNNFW